MSNELHKARGQFFSHFIGNDIFTNSYKADTRKISGLWGSSLAFFLAGSLKQNDRPHVVVCPSERDAENLYNDLRSILDLDRLSLYPDLGVLPYEDISPPGRIIHERVETLYSLLKGSKKIYICSIRAWLRRIIEPSHFSEAVIDIRKGEDVPYRELVKKLLSLGYTQENKVIRHGEFSVRGGIIDIYSSSDLYPVRLDFFGDTIEEIRLFYPQTQVSFKELESFHILPKKEIWIPPEEGREIVSRLQEKHKDKPGWEDFKEKLSFSWYFPGMENYLPFFTDTPKNLKDYLPEDSLIFFQEVSALKDHSEACLREYYETYSHPSKKNKIKIQPDALFQDIAEALTSKYCELLTFSSSSPEPDTVLVPSAPVPEYKSNLNSFKEQCREFIARGITPVLTASHVSQAKRLSGLLQELNPLVLSEEKTDARVKDRNRLWIIQSNFTRGFVSEASGIFLLCDNELFGKKKKHHRDFTEDPDRVLESYIDLKENDYVVHINHGIGLYRGLKRMEVGGKEKDYLELIYAGESKLFVPVEQVNLIQKFIGGRGRVASLDTLGGKAWDKVKRRVRTSVEDLAKSLVELYSVRRNRKKVPVPSDTYLQSEFESEFEFEETPDQLTAVEAIKADLESDRPMDRLICGDVGFGKTEVALRAVFKVVMQSMQCAVLVPTTILSQQHYQNFLERFRKFPVNLEVINRFKSTKQVKEILKRCSEGKVDVLIGTHRLLSKDVAFKNIGLLVIDEEQKFGVKQKEKIRELSRLVDTLTLSATPIPRTLHMSLIRIREVSLMNTPPQDRHPIQTFVMEFNEDIIKEAIRKEIEREGQVYYVYNRVETIAQVAVFLRKILPEARIGVGHGQMSELELEDVMTDFIEKKYDVLLSTTIIDSGLDIPNVNTILIHDADKFGLSQLYQLRGRVGRSTRQAYAYLFYRKDRALSEDAMKRLHSISEFISLGSGFKIAMRDLEIRGAGNLLGPQQSGDIMAVGFDLYCQLLDEAIGNIKDEKRQETIHPMIDIRYHGFIPDEYIPDNKEKIEAYKRLGGVRTEEEFNRMQLELEDRYGKCPPVILKLFDISRLRIVATELRIPAIIERVNKIDIQTHPTSNIDSGKILRQIQAGANTISFNPQQPEIVSLAINNQLKDERENTGFDEKISMVSVFLGRVKMMKPAAKN